MLGKPCTQYVQKLWYFRCSPSEITGEPVASNSSTVWRIASSYKGERVGSASSPAASIALSSEIGRGMLPIGSVGIVMGTWVRWRARRGVLGCNIRLAPMGLQRVQQALDVVGRSRLHQI